MTEGFLVDLGWRVAALKSKGMLTGPARSDSDSERERGQEEASLPMYAATLMLAFRRLRELTDPKGHDLLDAIEEHLVRVDGILNAGAVLIRDLDDEIEHAEQAELLPVVAHRDLYDLDGDGR